MDSTPEAQARRNIDDQLEESGWTVQDYKQADITAYGHVVSMRGPEKRPRAIIKAMKAIEDENKSPRGVLLKNDRRTCCGDRKREFRM